MDLDILVQHITRSGEGGIPEGWLYSQDHIDTDGLGQDNVWVGLGGLGGWSSGSEGRMGLRFLGSGGDTEEGTGEGSVVVVI